ncbi:hypothetical protein [Nocardioides sp. cx-173]|uniref:hypothetical protein n=1 Tax=Nocardioides sp. cx-173 TaxID=2898796 RepID=UPI001E4B4929|nr:hypothetical protein [Nocardioides sp. cx-173]MCD4525930.1 hypothetical protein [Nocardioides sp. cx-173]UGB40081.1 hypothetical protein LQ940_11785 [Nocardioides sp. cx-173]
MRCAALAATLVLALSACTGHENGPPSPAAADRAAAAADAAAAFVAFAQGEESQVRWAGVVRYYVHGALVAEFVPSFADDPDTWDGCHAGDTTYEGRDCPVSPLSTIGQDEAPGAGPVVEEAAPQTVGCTADLPRADVDATPLAWIRPDPDLRDCFSDYAVTLYLDDDERVSAVDLVLSGP